MEPQKPQPLSPKKAVVIGQLIVNLPVLILMFGAFFIGRQYPPAIGFLMLLAAFILSWVWWALSVPRWREWALRSGAPEDKVQRLAELTGLTWKKGSVFEKTEIRKRK